MTDYEELVDMGAESLIGLFGENAPENAATDIAIGYSYYEAGRAADLDAFAEDIWERYSNRIKHMEG